MSARNGQPNNPTAGVSTLPPEESIPAEEGCVAAKTMATTAIGPSAATACRMLAVMGIGLRASARTRNPSAGAGTNTGQHKTTAIPHMEKRRARW